MQRREAAAQNRVVFELEHRALELRRPREHLALRALLGELRLVEGRHAVEVAVDDDVGDVGNQQRHALDAHLVTRCFDEVPEGA